MVERSPKSLGLSIAKWIEKLGEFGETPAVRDNTEPIPKRIFREGVTTMAEASTPKWAEAGGILFI